MAPGREWRTALTQRMWRKGRRPRSLDHGAAREMKDMATSPGGRGETLRESIVRSFPNRDVPWGGEGDGLDGGWTGGYHQREEFKDMCRQSSEHYFTDNRGSVVSWEVVWEAQKACLRGQIISYVKGHREKSRQKIRNLEGAHSEPGGSSGLPVQDHLLRDRTHTQTLLRQNLHRRQERLGRPPAVGSTTGGDKASKTLHWLCTPKEGLTVIRYLQMRDGSRVMGHGPMAQAFANYYRDLYRADRDGPSSDLSQFVQNLPVPSLSVDDRASLGADIPVEELRAALTQLKPGKVPGPNGFQSEYWCLVWRQVSQPMLDM
ncbi:hypothetical protein NDU88_000504 [Pleurodeles waltl]|uniref:Reverse transcriptase n=1 Tax=Pleurodeles waltl TaxID=8319 RepID=A0AAV7S5V6_PLEWA|nr:hypothetical protein NDU88_000504 [Pleurodeles waltl]